MESPDQRLFEADINAAPFRSGVAKSWWGLATADLRPSDLKWSSVILWIGAPSRANAPDRFYVLLDLKGYPTVPPTGTFWDPDTKKMLALGKRPKGKVDSRFAKVFRTDWRIEAFYHPYDRVAAQSHPTWSKEQPHLVWKSGHTIVEYLEEIYSLFQSGDYLGI